MAGQCRRRAVDLRSTGGNMLAQMYLHALGQHVITGCREVLSRESEDPAVCSIMAGCLGIYKTIRIHDIMPRTENRSIWDVLLFF